jgi:hypothetical protein
MIDKYMRWYERKMEYVITHPKETSIIDLFQIFFYGICLFYTELKKNGIKVQR